MREEQCRGMQKEIGSNFYLNPENDYRPEHSLLLSDIKIEGSDAVFVSTGRSAENLVLDEIGAGNPHAAKVALIPPYTCETVIAPFLKHGYTLRAYPVREDLRTTPEMLSRAIEESGASVVLLHSFFGFDSLPDCETVLRRYASREVVFIEDRTQSLFSGFPALPAAYVTGSLRKWTGMPDGGFAVCRDGHFSVKPTEYDRELTKAKMNASFLKYRYLFQGIGEKAAFLNEYRVAEDILDAQSQYYAISPASEAVFLQLDTSELRRKRRENYQVILDRTRNLDGVTPVCGELTGEVTPLYFLLLTENREKLQIKLRQADIFAPIVWSKSEFLPDVCAEAGTLYRHSLCIPIDQRYDTDDMERVVKRIREVM